MLLYCSYQGKGEHLRLQQSQGPDIMNINLLYVGEGEDEKGRWGEGQKGTYFAGRECKFRPVNLRPQALQLFYTINCYNVESFQVSQDCDGQGHCFIHNIPLSLL